MIATQLLRAVFSIAANIAEGYGGARGKSFANYLTIARRSCYESWHWLIVARDLSLLSPAQYQDLTDLLKECVAMLTTMVGTLSKDL